jgi:hypothetical protein
LEKCGVAAFVPYVLRHSALTRLGEASGYASLTPTKRYVHPQAEAINRVFAAGASLLAGTNSGTPKKLSTNHRRKVPH